MPFVTLPVLALAGVALLASGQASAGGRRARRGAAAAPVSVAQPAAPAAASGMVVYVDPESGGLTSTPPSPEAAAEMLALGTPSAARPRASSRPSPPTARR